MMQELNVSYVVETVGT